MNRALGTANIMHLIGSTGLYGAERWILALMRAMDKHKFQSTLINLVDSDGERSAVVQAAEQRGLEAFDFVTGGKFNPFAASRLAKFVRTRQADIIHGHGYKSDLLGLLAAKLSGCHMMSTPHGWSLDKDRKLQSYEALGRFSFKFMDMVCPLSPDLFDGLSGFVDGRRLKLILNGVDIDEIKESAPLQRKYIDKFTVGYIGQLIERKDMSTLISAVHSLRKTRENIRLIILGDGVKRKELQTECDQLGISSIVEFHGFRPDAASWLKTFDVFALPSRLEGIPRCIMEALAAMIPVIASDIPGNTNLVVNGETGLLFPVGDSHKLAACLEFMMDHPVQAKEMAMRGNEKVESEYSNRKMAQEYALIYADMLATN